MTDLIRWQDNGYGGYLGYAGSADPWLFQIFKPDSRDPEWILTSSLPTLGAGKALCYDAEAGPLQRRAEEMLREFAASLGAVFPEPPALLRFDGTRCDEDVLDEDEMRAQCPESSRFLAERSDHDPSYDVTADRAPTEACEAHLAETVCGLMDGNDKIAAIVRVRWN